MTERYVERWALLPDGPIFRTPSSLLQPVLFEGRKAMLKVALVGEERDGARLMVWWNGEGAAKVLAHEDDALVLERAEGEHSLARMAESGQDDEASRLLCAAAARLHRPPESAPESLVPLDRWFRSLDGASGPLARSGREAKGLLREPRDVRVLHGDLHHGNVLDFGERGWRAIDPKGLLGERGFDFANLFCNPSMEVATAPGRLARQVEVVAQAVGLERRRLLRWIVAYAGLSAAWSMEDGGEATNALAVAAIAAAELDR